MTDAEIRIACINAAAATPGNPNHLQMAREYYAFVTEETAENKAEEAEVSTDEDTQEAAPKAIKKGSRK